MKMNTKQILNFINMTYIGKNIKLNGTDNSKSLEDTYNKNVLDKSFIQFDEMQLVLYLNIYAQNSKMNQSM